jgi:hypothetical protein
MFAAPLVSHNEASMNAPERVGARRRETEETQWGFVVRYGLKCAALPLART